MGSPYGLEDLPRSPEGDGNKAPGERTRESGDALADAAGSDTHLPARPGESGFQLGDVAPQPLRVPGEGAALLGQERVPAPPALVAGVAAAPQLPDAQPT